MPTSPKLHWTARLRRGFTDLWFILLTAAAALIFAVLLGYHSTDPGWSTSGTTGETANYLGTVGAYAADTFISLLGWASYLLPVGLLVIAWSSVRSEHSENELLFFKLIALFTLVLTGASMLALHVHTPINSLAITGGGMIGQKLTQILLSALPVRGVMYLNTFFFAAALLYIFEYNPLKVPEKVGYWVMALLGRAKSRSLEHDLKQPVPPPAADTGDAKRSRLVDRLTNRSRKPASAEPQLGLAPEQPAKPAGRIEPQIAASQPAVRQEPSVPLNWADYKDAGEDLLPAGENAQFPPLGHAPERPAAAAPHTMPRATPETEENPFAGFDAFSAPEASSPFTAARVPAPEDNALAAIQGDDDDFDGGIDFADDNPFTFSNDKPETPAQQGGLKVRLGGTGSGPQPAAQPQTAAYSPVSRPAAQPQAGFYQDVRDDVPYRLPSLNLLKPAAPRQTPSNAAQFEVLAPLVEEALKNYRLDVKVVGVDVGPVVTRLELDLAPGIKVSQIMSLDKDLARSLSVSSVRVVDVIPGKTYIGLEIPNKTREIVALRSIMESAEYQNQKSPLTLVLGADIAGKPMAANLAKMPHLLVAGTTGSGKSVAINVMLASMLYKATPEELKLILIDPKMLEMSMYEDIPHLLTPVVTDMNDAENALRWAVAEMERRYQLMAAFKVRNIAGFNQTIRDMQSRGERIDDPLWNPEDHIGLANQPPQITTLPYIVIVIDELADMMMAVGKSVEQLIARIAQKARAAGIHLILATQRPSVDVITGLIKANVPTRLAFQVSSKIDSRTIIDGQGAESLLGYGDGLFVPPGSAAPKRVHGAFIEDSEVDALTTYLKTQGVPHYEESITNPVPAAAMGAYGAQEKSDDPEQDPLYDQACQIVIESGKASISYVQRRLQVGYNRAARMIEQMEYAGIVSPADRGQRKVLVGGED